MSMSARRSGTCQQPGRISSNVVPVRVISSGVKPEAAMCRFNEVIVPS
jgi:hypothetical protein